MHAAALLQQRRAALHVATLLAERHMDDPLFVAAPHLRPAPRFATSALMSDGGDPGAVHSEVPTNLLL